MEIWLGMVRYVELEMGYTGMSKLLSMDVLKWRYGWKGMEEWKMEIR